MEYLECPKCHSQMLVQDEVEMKPHDDRLGGVNILFQLNEIKHDVNFFISVRTVPKRT